VGTAVLAGQEWALEVDPKDRRVSPGLGRRDANLGDQNVGGGRDQREQLTSSAVLAMESPSRTDGVAPLAVRCPGTTVVVDVEQSRAEDMPRAVDNIRVVFDEIAPAAARARCEDAKATKASAWSTPELINRTEWMTAEAALLTGLNSGALCGPWPWTIR
jgi:hypothetical protein